LTSASSAWSEERKVVAALFCDLVGFTAASESADPEDVDRMLTAYFAMARAQIEGYGGVVQKFIGDAVVGVFGAPAAHEDDQERAVRAGLRIVEEAERLEAVGGGPLRLRVGVNTGQALVRLGVHPGSGANFLAGDAISTASRLQSIAPEMGVAVGLGTFEASLAVFDYEELESAALKGKAELVRVFHAKASRARFGTDITRTHPGPFIGREIDLALLKGMFDKTVAASLMTANAALDEDNGHYAAAAAAYADAAGRWQRFGILPEHAFALLGQGRCLIASGRNADAAAALEPARALFEQLGATPALAETDALLAKATEPGE
jgi:class 3 adenylate cyclase